MNNHLLRTNLLESSMRPLLRPKRTKLTVRTGGHQFTIDEPPILARTNLGASFVEHLLASLGSCQVITYQVWAAKLGIELKSVEVAVTGDLDVYGFFGLDPEVRPGFQSIGVKVRLNGPESSERYAALTKAVDEHCPVHACPPSADFTAVSVTSGG